MAMELDLPHYSIYSTYFRTEDGFYNLMRQGEASIADTG